jgi:transposase
MGRNRRRQSWQELRRKQALQLIRRNWKQTKVAEALGVTPGAVSQWARSYHLHGWRGLLACNRSGAPRKLDQDQLNKIPELLWHGAEAYGFHGDLWTCRRIASVIELEFRVRYHPHHVARLMQELKWTPHLPVPRATQRNEAEIKHWKLKTWPELKKSQKREKKPISAG